MPTISYDDQHAEEYDGWFDQEERAYQAMLEAVRRFRPSSGLGLEVGVGTGRCAAPLGVEVGIDPSMGMLRIAHRRGVKALQAMGEHLPFYDGRFDFALLVGVLWQVADPSALLTEINRVLGNGGRLIVGFTERESDWGRFYQAKVHALDLKLYSSQEMTRLIREAGFEESGYCQTMFGLPEEPEATREVRDGCDQGGFIVVAARKRA